MSTATKPTTNPSTSLATPPPTEVEVFASHAYQRLAEADPWEGFTEEDRERGYRILTVEEGAFQFDRTVRAMLGISGDEFTRLWEAGAYATWADRSGYRYLMDLGMMISVVRQDP